MSSVEIAWELVAQIHLFFCKFYFCLPTYLCDRPPSLLQRLLCGQDNQFYFCLPTISVTEIAVGLVHFFSQSFFLLIFCSKYLDLIFIFSQRSNHTTHLSVVSSIHLSSPFRDFKLDMKSRRSGGLAQLKQLPFSTTIKTFYFSSPRSSTSTSHKGYRLVDLAGIFMKKTLVKSFCKS